MTLPPGLLAKRLAELVKQIGDGEVRTDDEGESWYTLPTGDSEAIEVDVDMNPNFGTPVFHVWIRAWDRTHALSSEVEAGSFGSTLSVTKKIHALMAEIADAHARLDTQMMDDPS
jgi:hypothetical protein